MPPPALCRVIPPSVNEPPSTIVVVGVSTPLSSAATAVIGLNVEPVGYRPWVARSVYGDPVVFEKTWSTTDCESLGLVNTEGS